MHIEYGLYFIGIVCTEEMEAFSADVKWLVKWDTAYKTPPLFWLFVKMCLGADVGEIKLIKLWIENVEKLLRL